MSEAAERFRKLIDAQTEAAGELAAVLEQEYAVLKGDKADGLEAFADSKAPHVEALARLGSEVNAILASAGFAADADGVAAFIQAEDADGEAELEATWQALLQLLGQCHHQNLVNGTVIELRHRSVQHLLTALTGQNGTQTYDLQGKTHSGSIPQSLAKA